MQKWWTTFPWRFIQTNLREIDMADIDAGQYVKDIQEFNATIAMINVGGIIASYDTDLPYHFQSEYLTGDSLQEIIAACHDAGIKVMARNDFSKIRRPIYEKHPDWAYRTKEGEIVDYNGDVHACINGEYQRVYALKIMDEILDKLDIDGVFFNMGGYQVRDYSYNEYGICHCDNCKRLFKEMYGLSLPEKADMEDPIYRKYRVFQRETLEKYNKEMTDAIRAKRPDIAINHEDLIRMESNTEFGRPLPHWQYSGSSNTRWIRTSFPHMRSSNTTVDFIGFFYRHVAVNPAQQELRLWQALANTGDLDYYLIGRLDNHQDKSGYAGIKRVYKYHKENEDTYLNLKSKADILLVREMIWTGHPEETGWVRMLTERHFLFDEILLSELGKADLSKYKAVILADSKYLSDKVARKLDGFVESGGTLIATGESGMYDGDYEPREYNALKSLGIKGHMTKRSDMRSAMLLIDDKRHYPTFQKWDTELLYFGDDFMFCDFKSDVCGHLKLIPPHNYGPPERCYYTQITDVAGFSERNYEKGKAIYIPWWPGAIFHREGYVNTSEFIGDMIENIVGISSVDTNASPMVEVTLCGRDDFSIVHLVNTTGHFGTTFYEPVPLYDITVSVPFDRQPERCVSLVDGRDIPFEFSGGKLSLSVGKVGFFEAVKII